MPAYNAERFLREAVNSVLAQTFRDWELIIVDDGSSDTTPDILASLDDQRLSVVRQQNQGEAVARNVALDKVRGNYVAFLDADDLYLPNAIADLAGHLDANPQVDVVFSDGFFCDEQARVLMRLSEHRPGPYTGEILEPLVLSASVIVGVIGTMTRRATIEISGARFDPALVIGPDWDFWIQLARYARFDYLDRLTCMYRVHQTNITRTSGVARRKADLVRGRLKVMNSPWFEDLSPSTRREFFYYLLVDLLGGDVEQQQIILDAPAFRAMPDNIQAELFRLVASNHLITRQNSEFALQCLRRSLVLCPDEPKSRALSRLTRRSPLLAAAVLSTWKTSHQAVTILQRRHGPKPAPVALRPVSD